MSYAHSLQMHGPGCGVFGRCRIAANADPTSTSATGTVAIGASGSQSQGRGLAALPPSTATPAPNGVTLPETQRYQVPKVACDGVPALSTLKDADTLITNYLLE